MLSSQNLYICLMILFPPIKQKYSSQLKLSQYILVVSRIKRCKNSAVENANKFKDGSQSAKLNGQ